MGNKLELLWDLIEGQKLYRNPEITFEQLCEKIDADAIEMDNYLIEELGCSGQEYLTRLRENEATHITKG